MTGRSIILVVVGFIVVASVTMFRIEAASTRIISNVDLYYNHQSARNIAQSGVSMGLRQLADSSAWRSGFPLMDLLTGKVVVTACDTTFNGRSAVRISAVGISAYGTSDETRDTSTAYVAQKPIQFLPKAAATTDANTKDGGGLSIDGRNHDTLGTLLTGASAGTGVFGLYTTGTLSVSGSSVIGGTNSSGKDIPTKGKLDTSIIRTSQVYPGGFPQTPDALFGGAAAGYPEGTMKTMAKSGQGGSQYVTDPSLLTYPLSGITYVEVGPGVTWSPKLTGGGILILHNSTTSAVFKQPSGTFSGLIVTDDLTNLSGLDILGALVQLTSTPTSDLFGSSNGSIKYSSQAILSAQRLFQGTEGIGSTSNVIGWWE